MLTDSDLAQMRADVARLLPESGYLLTASETSDGQGGFAVTWGTATAVRYRLDPLTGAEVPAGGAVQPYHAFTLTLPYNTVVTERQRLQGADGQVYAIKSLDAGKSWAVSRRAVVERVK